MGCLRLVEVLAWTRPCGHDWRMDCSYRLKLLFR
jgi:hypothetical protein